MNEYEEIKDDLYVVAKAMATTNEEPDELVAEMWLDGRVLSYKRSAVKSVARLAVLDYRKKRDKTNYKHIEEHGQPVNMGDVDYTESPRLYNPEEMIADKNFWEFTTKYLSSAEQIVVNSRYIDGKTFDEIAGEVGMSKSGVFELHEQAMSKLRLKLGADYA